MLPMSSDAGIRIGRPKLRENLDIMALSASKSSFLTDSMQSPTPLE